MALHSHNKKMSNTFYVYKYLREADSPNGKAGTPYYIGKGTGRRCYEKHHGVAVPKNRDRIVIVHENLPEWQAFSLEIWYIHKYGRIDKGTGSLRNLTDGGEGVAGRKWTDAERVHMSNIKRIAYTGEGNPMYGKKGNLNPNYGRTAWNKGKLMPKTPEHIEAQASAQRGENNIMYGKTYAEVYGEEYASKRKAAISAALKGRKQELTTCPHCSKTGGNGMMKRYHFDNCKQK
jgi:hypothetical protein